MCCGAGSGCLGRESPPLLGSHRYAALRMAQKALEQLAYWWHRYMAGKPSNKRLELTVERVANGRSARPQVSISELYERDDSLAKVSDGI